MRSVRISQPPDAQAAVVTLALTAACACKAFVISVRRRGGDAKLEAAAERCRVLAEAALAAPAGDEGPLWRLKETPRF